mmetsp:Transcript_24788/g.45989  ORF Transcript_24788/g.45989 Transcript_24788/m.45989 type:complete len:86 (+) Transcript_24788:146-403(+)
MIWAYWFSPSSRNIVLLRRWSSLCHFTLSLCDDAGWMNGGSSYRSDHLRESKANMADDTYHDSLARTLSAFDALSEEDEDALIGQ